MNIKLIIGLICTAAIGTNAFALQITKGKLISHKEWATDGAVASYLPATKTLASVQKAGQLTKTALELSAETESVATTVGAPVTIANDASIWVMNTSDEVKQYRYTFYICAFINANTSDCVYTEDLVELQPHGAIYTGAKPALQVAFDEAGVYDTWAGSTFTTLPMQTQMSQSSSTGTITVI
jgi:hypothetical protein